MCGSSELVLSTSATARFREHELLLDSSLIRRELFIKEDGAGAGTDAKALSSFLKCSSKETDVQKGRPESL